MSGTASVAFTSSATASALSNSSGNASFAITATGAFSVVDVKVSWISFDTNAVVVSRGGGGRPNITSKPKKIDDDEVLEIISIIMYELC